MPAISLLFSLLFLAGMLSAEENSIVRIEILGIRSQLGQVILQIYEDPDTFLQTASSVVVVPLMDPAPQGDAPVTVDISLPRRPVAICAYHDRNTDGTINRSAFGVPEEPYGWSRDVHPKWMPPAWDAVALQVASDMPAIHIMLRDW